MSIETWDVARPERRWVVAHLEEIVKKHGLFSQRTSSEIEASVFTKSHNAEEYMNLARRLLRHLMDSAMKSRLQPATLSASGSGGGGLYGGSGPGLLSLPFVPFVLPPVDTTTLTTSASPPVLLQMKKPTTAGHIIDLKTKRTLAAELLLYEPVEPAPGWLEASLPRTSLASFIEIKNPDGLSIVDASLAATDMDEEKDESDSSMHFSSDTYQASYTFMVPKNCVISKILVHLEKESA